MQLLTGNFAQQQRDEFLRDDLRQLVRLAIREDLARSFDLTTVAVVPEGLPAKACIVARSAGVAAGIELISWIVAEIGVDIDVTASLRDGEDFPAGSRLSTLAGDARDLLTCERTILNFLGRLCGIATGTRQYVVQIRDLPAKVYDTRKTTPGWRRLEKYAVRCGGGNNHRGGLYDAILIKDNHLACHRGATGKLMRPGEAVRHAREFLLAQRDAASATVVEIEVDSLEQLSDALPAGPDIVLLDNMKIEQLRSAVDLRDAMNPRVILEASGGVTLATIRSIAETSVDRISVGAITHSALNLDLGLDWELGLYES